MAIATPRFSLHLSLPRIPEHRRNSGVSSESAHEPMDWHEIMNSETSDVSESEVDGYLVRARGTDT